MNLSYTDKKINYSNVLFKYYLNIILISIDGNLERMYTVIKRAEAFELATVTF